MKPELLWMSKMVFSQWFWLTFSDLIVSITKYTKWLYLILKRKAKLYLKQDLKKSEKKKQTSTTKTKKKEKSELKEQSKELPGIL